MSFDYMDLFPHAPNDNQQVKLTFFGLAAGVLIGYNWDTVATCIGTTYNVISTVIEGLLAGEEVANIAPSTPKTRFIVGVGVIVRDGDKILMGKRLNSLGGGLFAVPGGHLEEGETFLMAGVRELLEETGISVYDIPFDNGAYIHPQTNQLAVDQYTQLIENQYQLVQKYQQKGGNNINNNINNNNNDNINGKNNNINLTHPSLLPITPSLSQSPTYNTLHNNIHNAFVAGPGIEVYCPEEHCQLIVRMVVVDRPVDQSPQRLEANKCEDWHWVKWSDVQAVAQYHDAVAKYQQYQALGPAHKAMVGVVGNEESKLVPDYMKNNNNNNKNKALFDGVEAPPHYLSTQIDENNNNKDNPQVEEEKNKAKLMEEPLGEPIVPPIPPQLTPGCVLKYTDQLFGPMQAIAITGFDPISAKSPF